MLDVSLHAFCSLAVLVRARNQSVLKSPLWNVEPKPNLGLALTNRMLDLK